MKSRKLSRLLSIIVSAVILLTAIMPTFSYAVTINNPGQYFEYRFNEALTVSWTAPTGKTVDHYTFSLRRWNFDDDIEEDTGTLLYNRKSISSSQLSFNIPASQMLRKNKYRLSICAVFTDGTEEWSKETYFYTSTHNGLVSQSMKFYVWNGLQDDTIEHIIEACNRWNAVSEQSPIYRTLGIYSSLSNVNEYNTNSRDMVNRITAKSFDDEKYLMATHSWRNKDGKSIEADININKKYNWANDAYPDCYDVQSIMTHELGHVLGLSDKYDSWATRWTMYGRGTPNSLKRSIFICDMLALMELYE